MMDSGIVAVPVGEEKRIDEELFSVAKGDIKLRRSIRTEEPANTPSGHRIIVGDISIEQYEEYTESEINDDRNTKSSTYNRKYVEEAKFVQVPGQFLFLESGSPTMMFNILGQVADCAYERAEIGLDQFILDQDEPSFWMLGFYERGTQADTGTLYGSEIGDDPIANDILQNATCNQVGIEHFYDDDGVKARFSESGYIELYSPDYNTKKFIDYIIEEISPQLTRPTV